MRLFGNDGQFPNNILANQFCLADTTLCPHNFLVDEEFHIIGFIDLRGVSVVPYDVAAQFPIPLHAGLDLEIHGHIGVRPLTIENMKRASPLVGEYIEMIKDIEETVNPSGRKLSEVMLSTGARIVRGFKQYRLYDKYFNERWMDVYTRILSEHARIAYLADRSHEI